MSSSHNSNLWAFPIFAVDTPRPASAASDDQQPAETHPTTAENTAQKLAPNNLDSTSSKSPIPTIPSHGQPSTTSPPPPSPPTSTAAPITPWQEAGVSWDIQVILEHYAITLAQWKTEQYRCFFNRKIADDGELQPRVPIPDHFRRLYAVFPHIEGIGEVERSEGTHLEGRDGEVAA